MSMKVRLSDDLKDAMRARDELRRNVLRSVLTAISNAEIARVDVKDASASRSELADADVVAVLRKQAKQRRESAEEYRKAARSDLAEREEAEAAIIDGYLPQELSRDEIASEIRAVIAETSASGPGDKGKVMPAAMARLRGRADGRTVNEVVTELLAGGA